MEKQPRRYKVRRLRDAQKLGEAEIAKQLGVSQATVSRDLKETVPPMGFTDLGTPYYPPGRFDDDPEYQREVDELAKEIPRVNARGYVAGIFSGAAEDRRASDRYEISPERMNLMETFAKRAGKG